MAGSRLSEKSEQLLQSVLSHFVKESVRFQHFDGLPLFAAKIGVEQFENAFLNTFPPMLLKPKREMRLVVPKVTVHFPHRNPTEGQTQCDERAGQARLFEAAPRKHAPDDGCRARWWPHGCRGCAQPQRAVS